MCCPQGMARKGEIMENSRCSECRHCDLSRYNSGKWYCSSPEVSVFSLPPDTDKCFEKRELNNPGLPGKELVWQ